VINFAYHLFLILNKDGPMPNTVQLPWGNEALSFDIPDTWRIVGVLEPAQVGSVPHAEESVRRALAEPVGSPSIAQLCRSLPAQARVAIVIDDGSRPTPVAQILSPLLIQLLSNGVSLDRLVIVPALGVHRPMEEKEIYQRAGIQPGIIRVENPDCDDPNKLTNLGTTSRGTPVLINKTVAEAGLVVSIGCIEPHIIASFGGGYKNLVPGVAGRATIAHNHALNCSPGTFNMVGQPIENNPMRLDLEEAAAKLAPKVFLINAILSHTKEVIKVVAGDPVAAHRAGVTSSAGLYGVKVARPVDVVITCSAPMDSDLRQGVKALANTIRAVKPGGVVITFVRAEEGVGVFGLANRKLPIGRRALKLFAPIILRAVPRMKLKGMGEEDRFFLYFALQAMRHARNLMIAPTIPFEIHERLPFVEFVPDAQAAILEAQKRFKDGADVLVFPHGGITYPNLGS
jgi:lactate racemase